MVIALGVFVYSAYRLTLIYIESKDSLEVYDEVKNMFLSGEAGGEAETDEKGMTISNSNNGGKFVWDYDKMLAYNPEAVGYIRQDNGEYIDNPILLHSDNEYYLNHLANNQVSSVGSIFVDYRITEGLEARNAIIYGHNMGKRVNNIMFGSLNWYYYCDSDPEYYKNHPTFDVYVGYKHYKYYVFAVYKTEAEGGWTYTYSFENDEAFLTDLKQYIKNYPQRIKYTCEHKKAFLQVEKELCGKNSINGYFHDLDKLIMYVAGLPQKLVQKIHLSTSQHHIRNGKVKNPIMAVIDWECAHLTKPDKPLRAREFYEKFCPKMPEVEAALKKLGL